MINILIIILLLLQQKLKEEQMILQQKIQQEKLHQQQLQQEQIKQQQVKIRQQQLIQQQRLKLQQQQQQNLITNKQPTSIPNQNNYPFMRAYSDNNIGNLKNFRKNMDNSMPMDIKRLKSDNQYIFSGVYF